MWPANDVENAVVGGRLELVNWFEHWDWSAIIVSYDPRAEMEALGDNWAGEGLGMSWLARLLVDWRVMCWQCRLGARAGGRTARGRKMGRGLPDEAPGQYAEQKDL